MYEPYYVRYAIPYVWRDFQETGLVKFSRASATVIAPVALQCHSSAYRLSIVKDHLPL